MNYFVPCHQRVRKLAADLHSPHPLTQAPTPRPPDPKCTPCPRSGGIEVSFETSPPLAVKTQTLEMGTPRLMGCRKARKGGASSGSNSISDAKPCVSERGSVVGSVWIDVPIVRSNGIRDVVVVFGGMDEPWPIVPWPPCGKDTFKTLQVRLSRAEVDWYVLVLQV